MADKGLHNLYTKEYQLHGILLYIIYAYICRHVYVCYVLVPAGPLYKTLS